MLFCSYSKLSTGVRTKRQCVEYNKQTRFEQNRNEQIKAELVHARTEPQNNSWIRFHFFGFGAKI